MARLTSAALNCRVALNELARVTALGLAKSSVSEISVGSLCAEAVVGLGACKLNITCIFELIELLGKRRRVEIELSRLLQNGAVILAAGREGCDGGYCCNE